MVSEEGTIPDSFYEATVTPIPKLHRDSPSKKENYRPISLMNTESFNKILPN